MCDDTDWCNQIGNPEVGTRIYGNLVYDKEIRLISIVEGKKDFLIHT